MFLEAVGRSLEPLTDALFRSGIAAFLVAVVADGAIHVAGLHQFEPAGHLGIFAGMAIASLALVIRGSAPHRKERSHATR